MARRERKTRKEITNYAHTDAQRVYNPPVGLVTPDSDKDADKRSYVYDPHLDPQLVWAGKSERTSFDLPTVSLHVHERIDPRTIVEKFEQEAEEVRFAVILLIPDDESRLQGETDLKPRARQNVIFELGYFAGSLGRNRNLSKSFKQLGSM